MKTSTFTTTQSMRAGATPVVDNGNASTTLRTPAAENAGWRQVHGTGRIVPGNADIDHYDMPTMRPSLEFTRLISRQFLESSRHVGGKRVPSVDPIAVEDAIAGRAQLFLEAFSFSPKGAAANGLPGENGRQVISPTTALLWARLDADGFRALNKLNRERYVEVARWIDENPCPAYQDALRHYAPDIYNIVGATRRVPDVSNSPVRKLPSKVGNREQFPLPFEGTRSERPVPRDVPRCGP